MTTRGTQNRGFTLIEMALTISIFALVMSAITQSMQGVRGLRESAATSARVTEDGSRALRQVLSDLRRCGFEEIDGLEYPHLFTDGVPGADFGAHAHPASTPLVDWGGPSREIVFRLPADADEDGTPDLDADGNLVWGDEEISYVVITGPDGVNRLLRRTDAGGERLVTRFVDRIVVDDAATSGFAIPLDSLRVHIDMARPDDRGMIYQLSLEGVVRARNGGILP